MEGVGRVKEGQRRSGVDAVLFIYLVLRKMFKMKLKFKLLYPTWLPIKTSSNCTYLIDAVPNEISSGSLGISPVRCLFLQSVFSALLASPDN